MAISNKASKGKTEKPAPAPAAKVAAKPMNFAGTSYEPTREEIQTRAFEIYVSEGCKPGNDLANWVRAEKELRARGPR